VLGVVLPVLGLVLLAWVLARVPWRDRVHLKGGEELTGRLVRARGALPPWRFELPDGTVRTLAAGDLAAPVAGGPAGRGGPVEPGVLGIVGDMDARRLGWVALLPAVLLALGIARWSLLLRAQGIRLPVREVTALSFLGNFFNSVVPGLVGGDLVKAVYVARASDRPTAAVVTVFLDRVAGLAGTVVLAVLALAPRFGDARFHGLILLCYGVLAGMALAVGLVLSRRLRARFRVEERVARLPLGEVLTEADRAVSLYRHRGGVLLGALGISVLIHVLWCAVNALLGGMLGIELSLAEYFAVIPAALVVSAVPLLPGGWGVGEAAYAFFLGAMGVPAAQAVALSVVGRTIQLLWSLPGGIVFLARRV